MSVCPGWRLCTWPFCTNDQCRKYSNTNCVQYCTVRGTGVRFGGQALKGALQYSVLLLGYFLYSNVIEVSQSSPSSSPSKGGLLWDTWITLLYSSDSMMTCDQPSFFGGKSFEADERSRMVTLSRTNMDCMIRYCWDRVKYIVCAANFGFNCDGGQLMQHAACSMQHAARREDGPSADMRDRCTQSQLETLHERATPLPL